MSYTLVTSQEDLGHVANRIDRVDVLGIDLETTHLRPWRGNIRLMSLRAGDDRFVIDLFKTGRPEAVLTALSNPKTIKIAQNAKFDQSWLLHHFGLELWPLFDTFRASALIHNGREGMGHDLHAIQKRELNVDPGLDLGGSNWKGELTQHQLDYSALDVEYLPALRDSLRATLIKLGLGQTAAIEFGAVLPEASIENNGFYLDPDMWLKLCEKNTILEKDLREKLSDVLPHPRGQLGLPGMDPVGFNFGSTQQLQKSLALLGIHVDGTSAKELGMILPKVRKQSSREALVMLMQYKKIRKRLDSFGPEYLNNIDPITGRVHSSFYPFTGAGRYSSSKPNLQQLPREFEYRDCFRPRGNKLGVWDYSQIELRLAAEISNDPAMISAYANGQDLHILTASLLNDRALDAVTKPMRQAGKAGNFGLIYGMQAAGLVTYAQTNYGVSMSEDEANAFRDKFFAGYSGLKRWHRAVFSESNKRNGYTRTLSGRIRYLDPKLHNEFANCLDFETEALTQRGWVRGFDLTVDDVLLTKNPKSGALEWQRPTQLCLFPDYAGPLVEFRSRSFHAVSTPDHRWLVRDKSSGQDIERTTRTLSPWGDHRIHRTGDYRPALESVLSGDEAELLGWFVTDGYLNRGQKRKGKFYPFKNPQTFLTQSVTAKPGNCARIDALVSRLGGCTGRYESRTQVGVGKQIVWNLGPSLSRLLLARCPDRTLSVQALLDLDRTALDRLREAMLLGDGTQDAATGKCVFCTGRKEQAEAFQVLCTLTGVSASLTWRDMSQYTPLSAKLANVPKMTGIWIVTLQRRDTAQVVHSQRKELVAKCPVWCPVVPNTFFVARRSGQVFVTGNTPVQGSGADGLKRALRIVYDKLKVHGSKVKMVNHVHDEIAVEAEPDADLLQQVDVDVKQGMIDGMQVFLKKVPVVVEGHFGDSWGEK